MFDAWIKRFSKIEPEVSKFTTDVPELERCEYHHVFIIDDLQRGRRNHKILNPIWSNGLVNKGWAPKTEWIATGFTEAQFHCWKRVPDPSEIEIKEEEAEHFSGKDEKGFYPIPSFKRKVKLHPKPTTQVEQTVIIAIPKKDQRNITEWTEINKFKDHFNHFAKIKGELWKVHHSRIVELDKYMYNNVLYKRQRIVVEVPLKEVTPTGVNRTISEQEAFMYIGIPEIWEPQLDGGYLFQPMTIYNNSNFNRKYYSYTKLEDQED